MRRTRTLQRSARKRAPYPTIALVGYTNAGKSTLFNRLTKAEVVAKDMLFATLDPTLRTLKLPDGRPGDPVRHRGLHLRPAARAGRGLPRHPGGGAGGRRRSCTCATSPATTATPRPATCAEVLAELGVDAAERPPSADRGLEQDRPAATKTAREAICDARRALRRRGLRLGGDRRGLRRPAEADRRCSSIRTLERDFDLAAEDGEAIAWLYRHGRVLNAAKTVSARGSPRGSPIRRSANSSSCGLPAKATR